ncbi:MFS transporter [Nocardioides jensenii]|uniref:MFS transporter n=1 Tax=Nocardioides jensenii TaxID=1843 RepID=UPI001FE1EB6A|nr:MFS transporter [Nocardioides jensenii]
MTSQAPDHVTAPEPSTVSSNAIVFVLSVAGITGALMQTLVVPLIQDLPDLLNTTASNASWVITATLLTAAVATPVSGRLGDLYGKRRMMLVCSGALVIGSAVCALAASVVPMIVGRGLQGVGMGMIPLGISAMRDLLPAEKLGTSIALMSASMGVGGALGLPIAAAVAEVNWRLLFWGSTALAVLIATLIFKLVPATPVARNTSGFDYVGAVGLGAGLVCLLLGVSKGADWGWGSATTVGLLVASVVILLVWGWFELTLDAPLVDLRVTARPVVLLTNVASLVVGFSMYAQSLIIPQLMQMPKATGFGLGESMLAMGLWMMPGGLVMMLVSPLGAKLSHLRGPKVTLAVGSFVVSLGYVAAVLMMGSAFTLMLAVCIGSAGVGLAYGAMPALIMGSVPVSETASANSFNTLSRSVGTSIAAAVVGVVLAQMTMDLGGTQVTSENGFKTGLLIGAAVALVASLVAMAIPSKASRDAEESIEHEVATV